jgi:hypothetical protein
MDAIDMDDQVEPGGVVDGAEVIDHVFLAHAETQPHVRRHHQNGGSAGFARGARVHRRLLYALAIDGGDDGNGAGDLLHGEPRHVSPLLGQERKDLARMPVRHDAGDAVMIHQPAHQAPEPAFVDLLIVQERQGNGRNHAGIGLHSHSEIRIANFYSL